MLTQSQPGSGRILQLTTTGKVAGVPGATFKGEVALLPSTFAGGSATLKHDGPDFHAGLTLASGQGGASAEVGYHQAVTPRVSLGGGVTAQLDSVAPPTVSGLSWSAFGVWTAPRRDSVLLGKFESGTGKLGLRYWAQAHKNVALGAGVSLPLVAGGAAPGGGSEESVASVGAKYTLGADSGTPATLTANLSSDLKFGVSWAKANSSTSQNISNTYAQTVVSGVFDAKTSEHKLGVQLIAQY